MVLSQGYDQRVTIPFFIEGLDGRAFMNYAPIVQK